MFENKSSFIPKSEVSDTCDNCHRHPEPFKAGLLDDREVFALYFILSKEDLSPITICTSGQHIFRLCQSQGHPKDHPEFVYYCIQCMDAMLQFDEDGFEEGNFDDGEEGELEPV